MSNEARQKRFRIALSHDVRHKGNAVFDLSSLTENPGIDVGFIEPNNGFLPATELADYDALILLFPRFARESIPANHRLGLIAKVGVGYDNVDVPACTEAGIALVTAPDGAASSRSGDYHVAPCARWQVVRQRQAGTAGAKGIRSAPRQ
jgi:hypothetical protein